MSSLRRGYLYGLAAYGLWGFFPIYFKLLYPSSAVELLAHRVIWSLVFVAILLVAVIRRWGFLRDLLRRPLTLLGAAVAATTIAVNWGTYIYGVNTDRVVETSLGYFINPLFTVLLGVIVLRERLRRWQWVAIGVGVAAVGVLTIDYGRPPFIALILAATFGSYSLIKKRLGLPAAAGLLVETAVLAGPALGYLWWVWSAGEPTLGHGGAAQIMLVLASGPLTAAPLMLFAGAANRISLSALGIMQYITPLMQFSLGVLLFREPMPPSRLAGFCLVWLALIIFTVDSVQHGRRREDQTIAPASAPATTH